MAQEENPLIQNINEYLSKQQNNDKIICDYSKLIENYQILKKIDRDKKSVISQKSIPLDSSYDNMVSLMKDDLYKLSNDKVELTKRLNECEEMYFEAIEKVEALKLENEDMRRKLASLNNELEHKTTKLQFYESFNNT